MNNVLVILSLLIIAVASAKGNRPGSVAVAYPFSFDLEKLTEDACASFPEIGSEAEIAAADALCGALAQRPELGGVILEAAVEQCASLFSCSTKLFLREHGQPFEPSDRDGWHGGVLKRVLTCAQKAKGADFASVSETRMSGYTALHLAALFQFPWAARAIAQLGANVDAPATSDHGFSMTPLHLAAINWDAGTANVLLDAGASVLSKDAFERTPYDVAIAAGANDVVNVMARYYPDVCSAPAYEDDTGSDSSSFDAKPFEGGWRVNTSRSIEMSGIEVTSALSCGLSRVDARHVKAEYILKEYISIGRPFILMHALEDWPARQMWTKSKFREKFGKRDVLAGSIPYAKVFSGARWGIATISEFMDYMEKDWLDPSASKVDKLYVFDSEFIASSGGECCPLPEVFASFFEERFDYISQFILGPADSGAPQHFHSDAINSLLFGRKYWILTPPSGASYLKEGAWSWMSKQDESSDNAMLGCLQEAGEVMYVPRFWGHSVLNFDESVAVAFEFDRGGEC